MGHDHQVATVSRSGFAVWRLSNTSLSLEVVPELGARIVSLKSASTGREWCWGAGDESRLFANDYGDSFADSPNIGFDECFPTVAACKWRGRELPCHGEVWSVPWAIDEDALQFGMISTTVTCRQSPFELNRQVSVSGNRVEMKYSLRNTGHQAEEYLWAFHPMIRVTSGDRLELPEEVQEIRVEGCTGIPEAAPGASLAWPQPLPGFRLDRFELGGMNPASLKGFTGSLQEGRACIANRTNGECLDFRWEAGPNPFLGIWINRGAYQGFQDVAALEPTNGQTDFLCEHHSPPSLPAGQTCSWAVSIALGEPCPKC